MIERVTPELSACLLLPHLRNNQGFLSLLHFIDQIKELVKYRIPKGKESGPEDDVRGWSKKLGNLYGKGGPEDDVRGGQKNWEIYMGKVDQRMM
jgi:hypothetical protein